MPLGEPSRVGYPGLSFLDPPVSGVAQPAFEASRSERRIGEEIRDIGVKRALVLVQREKVISALVDDFLGDTFCVPIASMVTMAPSIGTRRSPPPKPEPREQAIQLLPTPVGPAAINIVEGRQRTTGNFSVVNLGYRGTRQF